MTQTSETKARIQYSSRDELDVAVIGYCRGKSRHDLHARMRSALNGCYGPFAMAAVQAPQDEIRRQAVRINSAVDDSDSRNQGTVSPGTGSLRRFDNDT